LNGPAPRPANYDEVRAYYAGTLDAETREEVARLMICYKEWSEAEQRYLRDVAAESRAKRRDDPESSTNE
jgi:hypothetical protein